MIRATLLLTVRCTTAFLGRHHVFRAIWNHVLRAQLVLPVKMMIRLVADGMQMATGSVSTRVKSVEVRAIPAQKVNSVTAKVDVHGLRRMIAVIPPAASVPSATLSCVLMVSSVAHGRTMSVTLHAQAARVRRATRQHAQKLPAVL